MNTSQMILFWILVVPGTVILGLVSQWIVRKVSAVVQWRIGPPLFQPFYDVLKLLGKEILIPQQANRMVFMFAPLLALLAVVLLSVILLWALIARGVLLGDIIVAIYLMVLPSLALILAGSSSASAHASIGTAREMKLVIGYELPLIMSFIVVLIKDSALVESGTELNIATLSQQMPVLSISGMLAFLVALMCVQAKLGLVPFDIAEAETELGSGILMEYSGLLLGLWKLAQAVMLVALPLFLVTVFMGGLGTFNLAGIGFLAAIVLLAIVIAGRIMADRSKLMDIAALVALLGLCILAGFGKFVLILVLMILIKNTNPRLRIDQAMRFFWVDCFIVMAVAIILASIGSYFGLSWL